MSVVAGALMLLGSAIAVLAGVGVIRLSTTYARFHAAGKASPVAFIVTAIGASLEMGWQGAATLTLAVVAMTLTLPVGVHLLFRAVHRTTPGEHLLIDELATAERNQQSTHQNRGSA